MFKTLQGRIAPLFSSAQARKSGRAGLHGACVVVLAGLAIQLALGMVVNMYVDIPASDAQASYLREIETAPAMLTAHAVTGLVVLAVAVVLLLRAIALRDGAVLIPAAAGLMAVLGAFGAGEAFVKNGADSASLAMAILTGVALLCYTGLHAIIGKEAHARQRAREYHADLVN